MNNRARASASEYGIAVLALSVPALFLGLQLSNLIDAVFGGLLGKISNVAMTLAG